MFLKYHEYHITKIISESVDNSDLFKYIEENFDLEEINESFLSKVGDAIKTTVNSIYKGSKFTINFTKVEMLGVKLKKAMIEKAKIESDKIKRVNQLENRKESMSATNNEKGIESIDNSIADIEKITEIKLNALQDAIEALIEKINAIADNADSSYISKVASLVKANASYKASMEMLKYVTVDEKETLKKEIQLKKETVEELEQKVKDEEAKIKAEKEAEKEF
jgi:polyhydroxyalkanoate synthesis regulator phasin